MKLEWESGVYLGCLLKGKCFVFYLYSTFILIALSASYCIAAIFSLHRLNCSTSDIGLLNPITANPENYQNIDCPCKLGVPICPANITQQGELLRYQSVTYDEFYDLADKNISTWILRTQEELTNLTRLIYKFGKEYII